MSNLTLTDDDVGILSRFAEVYYDIKAAIKARMALRKQAWAWVEKEIESYGANDFDSEDEERLERLRLFHHFFLRRKYFKRIEKI